MMGKARVRGAVAIPVVLPYAQRVALGRGESRHVHGVAHEHGVPDLVGHEVPFDACLLHAAENAVSTSAQGQGQT